MAARGEPRENQTLYIIIVNRRDQDCNGLAISSDDNREFRLGLFSVRAQSRLDVSERSNFPILFLMLPSSTECLVELHEALVFVAAILSQGEFCIKQ